MGSFFLANSRGLEVEVLYDDEDTELLAQYKWHLIPDGYVVSCDRKFRGDTQLKSMHRLVLDVVGDKTAENVDHINRNKSDNRKANLRVCTIKQNAGNRKISKRNTSGFKGVHWVSSRNRYAAVITYKGKGLKLGSFRSLFDAAAAYNRAAKVVFGEFANPNVIPSDAIILPRLLTPVSPEELEEFLRWKGQNPKWHPLTHKHGWGAYCNHGCRCDICIEGMRDFERKNSLRKKLRKLILCSPK